MHLNSFEIIFPRMQLFKTTWAGFNFSQYCYLSLSMDLSVCAKEGLEAGLMDWVEIY